MSLKPEETNDLIAKALTDAVLPRDSYGNVLTDGQTVTVAIEDDTSTEPVATFKARYRAAPVPHLERVIEPVPVMVADQLTPEQIAELEAAHAQPITLNTIRKVPEPKPKPLCQSCGEAEATMFLCVGDDLMCGHCHAAQREQALSDLAARIEIGRLVHKAFAKATGTKRRDADLSDLLCDLMHYASFKELDFHESAYLASQNYEAERQARHKALSGFPITT